MNVKKLRYWKRGFQESRWDFLNFPLGNKKFLFLLMIILVVPFVSAAFFDGVKDMFSGGRDFVTNNYGMLGGIAGLAFVLFLVIRFGRGGVHSRGFFRRKRGPGWLTTRKQEHEDKVIAKLRAKEGRIFSHEVDLNKKALQVIENFEDRIKYEEKFRAWAKRLKSKVRKFRRVIVKNLNSFEKNAKRSYGWRRYLPGGIRKGFINPDLVGSRLNELFRNVVNFLERNLENIERFRPFLENMRGFLDHIIEMEKEAKLEAKEAEKTEKKEAKEIGAEKREEEEQISRARRWGRFVGRQLERTKALGRLVKKERKAEKKIAKRSKKAERLAKKIRNNIDEQILAIDDMVEVRGVVGESIYEFEGNAKRLEKDLKIFKKNIFKDVAKLLSLHRKVGRLERGKVKTIKSEYKVGREYGDLAAAA